VTRVPTWALAGALVAVIATVLAGLAVLGSDALPERAGPPIEELAVERTVLRPGTIELRLRNPGPDPVRVAQVAVNDAFADFTGAADEIGRLGGGRLTIDYPWQEGSPYIVSMLTETGAVITHEIAAAVQTPEADGSLLGLMALLGTYVGVIPVVLGMLLLPVLRRSGRRWATGLMAFTVGLLAFLAVDGTLEALKTAGESAQAFGGPELLFLGAGLAFLALTAVDRLISGRRDADAGGPDGAGGPGRARTGWSAALMVSIGIGLHNLGEGLAIGSAYAIGELALGAFLVIGFAIHNTTEGLAIVAPLSGEDRGARPSAARLLGLGLIAGGPAIVGAFLGATVTSAELATLLLGVGVGAIVQVVVQLTPALRDRAGRILHPVSVGGLCAGMLALYATSLLVAA
jgi:ZIP family zinc transporter